VQRLPIPKALGICTVPSGITNSVIEIPE
jgi:hypothetical protein